jgi:pimeloyl-ACP methyl ester carboxylesterase
MPQETIRSTDGTSIAVHRTGDGPPLVVIPGALSGLISWEACVSLLARHHRVHVIDRRGRGGSGDASSYEPVREVEDVLSVLTEVGGHVDLLGHSSGAVLALQAAEREPSELRRMVLYEPPLFIGPDDRMPADLPERLDALLAAGDEDGAVRTFLREGPRSSDEEIDGVRRHRAWAPMVAMARTVSYDARIVAEFDPDLRRFAQVRTRTLMLIGTQSPSRMRKPSEAIARVLSDVRIQELDGQSHQAQLLAPDALADPVERFLSED